jgi:hypothetical protein
MIITLCGSTRFPDAFALMNMHLSLMGHVVISVGLSGHADEPRGARFITSDGDESTPIKKNLDQLHFRKIDISDAICVINVGGCVGPVQGVRLLMPVPNARWSCGCFLTQSLKASDVDLSNGLSRSSVAISKGQQYGHRYC